VTRRGDALVIFNRAPQVLSRAVVKTSDRCGAVGAVPAGGEATVAFMDCVSSPQSGADPAPRRWETAMLRRLEGENVSAGAYLLVVDGGDSVPAIEIRPAIAIRSRELVAVRGPLLGEGAVR
jgi:hypothetical protein